MERVTLFSLNRVVILFFLAGLGFQACSQKAYVSGRVVRESGNQMPSPDLPQREPKGFVTTIYFLDPFKGQGNVIFKSIYGKELAKVSTNKEGFFKVRLLPGKYSVLMAKDSLSLYSNIQDGEGFVNPYQFEKGKRYKLKLIANWDAVY